MNDKRKHIRMRALGIASGEESKEIVQKRAKERRGGGDGASQMLVRANMTRCTKLIICTAGRSDCDNLCVCLSLSLLLLFLSLLLHVAHRTWPFALSESGQSALGGFA